VLRYLVLRDRGALKAVALAGRHIGEPGCGSMTAIVDLDALSELCPTGAAARGSWDSAAENLDTAD